MYIVFNLLKSLLIRYFHGNFPKISFSPFCTVITVFFTWLLDSIGRILDSSAQVTTRPRQLGQGSGCPGTCRPNPSNPISSVMTKIRQYRTQENSYPRHHVPE